MSKQALCYLVLGASLSVFVQTLAKRHRAAAIHPPKPTGSGNVVDFAVWKDARSRAAAVSAD